VTAPRTDHSAADVLDVLRLLAVSRSSGALELRGSPGGTIFLHEGAITYAETPGVPPVRRAYPADPQLPSAIRSAVVEVGLTLLAGPNQDGERPLFRPGHQHWTGLACRIGVEALLFEIADQREYFRSLGVGLNDQIRLCSVSPGRAVVLSRQQWALAAGLSGSQSALSVARGSGVPLGATIANLAALVQAGVATVATTATTATASTGSADPIRAAPAHTADPSASPVLPSFGPISAVPPRRSQAPGPAPAGGTAAAPVRLPHRVRGATSLPPPGTDAQTRRPPLQDVSPDSGNDLALRLLEGLRRL
jgi:hypothetical protein